MASSNNSLGPSRKLSLCLHLASLFPLIQENGVGQLSPRLQVFFDTIVSKYRLYATSCESSSTSSILTLIDPDAHYFEAYGTQPKSEQTTIHVGQDLDLKHLNSSHFIYVLPLEAESENNQQDVAALTKTLEFLHQQYHEGKSDLGAIIQKWQHQVLAGVTCTFSGLIPQDDSPTTTRFWQLASMYGADCCLDLTGKVTHLIASRTGTTKVNKAHHYPPIHVVTVRWLLSSVAVGYCQDEDMFPLVSSLPASTVVTPVTTPLGEDDEDEDTRTQEVNDIDWDEADREVNDYMNESGTDDNYSSGPDSPDIPRSRKRKAPSGSPLAIRRAKTAERGPSRLSTVMVNPTDNEDEDEDSSLSSFAGELDDEIE